MRIDHPHRKRHGRHPSCSDTLDKASGRGWPAAMGEMVMRNVSFAVLVMVALLASPAAQAADADVLRQFGMQGRQAIDCSRPYSQDNPHVIYGVSPRGEITRTLRMTPELDGTFPMRNLRMLSPDTMQFDETGRQSELTITVARIDGKFRSWRSVRANGEILIADGKFASSGNPTVAFEKCSN